MLITKIVKKNITPRCANYYREYDSVEKLNCHDDCPFMDDRGGYCQCMITGDTEYSPMKWRYNIGV